MTTHGCWIQGEQIACARYGNRGGIPAGGRTTFKTAAFDRSATSPRGKLGHLETIPGRMDPANAAMSVHQAHFANVPDKWQFFLDPIWLDLDLIDFAGFCQLIHHGIALTTLGFFLLAEYFLLMLKYSC